MVSGSPHDKSSSFHPLMPRRFDSPGFVSVLKKLHSWIGVASIAATIVFAYSGIALNHRADEIQIGAPAVTTHSTLAVPSNGFSSVEQMANFVRLELDLNKPDELFDLNQRSGDPERRDLSPRMTAQFVAPRERYTVDYIPGSSHLEIEHSYRPLTRMLNQMHMGNGGPAIWIFILNTYAFALIFLSISGILIWSRISGTGTLGAGIALASSGVLLYFLLPAL